MDENALSGERWMAAMLQGDFAAAWVESDAIRARGAEDPHRFWDGESLRGKRVIVRCLHGFGDAVQMLRYAPILAEVARSVVWQVAPKLVELVRCFDRVDEVATWEEEDPEWESQVEVMELPYIFRTTLEDLPIAERYCRVPAEEMARVRECVGMSEGRRVASVWAGSEWNRERTVPFAELRPLVEIGGLWNLQGGEARSEGVGMLDATAICGDGLLALAATIATMNLVITVDTLAAHLAGALGVPVWLMLQRNADWRWQAEGERSPWYPSMRLFRQTQQGIWADVVTRICKEMT